MHYYQRNIGDYARDTGHLTPLEHGLYMLILDWYYLNERPITDPEVARISRGYNDEALTVLGEFFKKTDAGWVHSYADREIAKYHSKAETNRRNGQLGGRPRARNNPEETQSVPRRNPDITLTNNQEPLTKKDQKQKQARATLTRPAGVAEQTWDDWLALRKAKRAPVTQTVIDQARREAEKAGIPLGRFLEIWCARGSQGLQADWLKPNERAGPVNGKHSAADTFHGKTYTGTAIDDLPADLRPS